MAFSKYMNFKRRTKFCGLFTMFSVEYKKVRQGCEFKSDAPWKSTAQTDQFIDSGTVTGAGGLAQPSLYSLFGGNSLPVAGTVLDIVAPAGGTNAQITVTAGTITLSGLRIGNVNDEYFVDLGASDFATQLQSATSPKAADITYFGDGSVKKPFNILL